MQPVIWITGPDKGGTAAWLAAKFAIQRSGGKPVRITPSNFEKVRRKSPVDIPHGLIIGGGADIDPGRYEDLLMDLKNIRTTPDENEPRGERWITLLLMPLIGLLRKVFSAGSITVDFNRDDLEWRLLKHAIDAGLPVLGICRGAQLINVYHGGTLYRDLSSFYEVEPNIMTIYPRKQVRLEEGSRLRTIISSEYIRVNSLHKQAVRQAGKGIRVVGKERGGVIQAIEHHESTFMIGVQWHPEYLPQMASQRRLFDELLRCAILYRDTDGRRNQPVTTRKWVTPGVDAPFGKGGWPNS